jgi:hypothetical protein
MDGKPARGEPVGNQVVRGDHQRRQPGTGSLDLIAARQRIHARGQHAIKEAGQKERRGGQVRDRGQDGVKGEADRVQKRELILAEQVAAGEARQGQKGRLAGPQQAADVQEDGQMLVLDIVVEVEALAEQPGDQRHTNADGETRRDIQESAAGGVVSVMGFWAQTLGIFRTFIIQQLNPRSSRINSAVS